MQSSSSEQQFHGKSTIEGQFVSSSAVMTTTATNSSTSNDRLKSYLIEKLLNETPPPMPPASSKEKDEDALSETGTYTIEDDETAENNKKEKKTTTKNYNNNKLGNELNDNNTRSGNDIESARAAIDETFGIIKRPIIESTTMNDERVAAREAAAADSASNDAATMMKKLSNSRIRNLTYSLTADVLNSNNNNNRLKNNQNESTEGANGITNNRSSLALESSRTINTQMLLGDTDKLIEQLKRKKTSASSSNRKALSSPDNKSPHSLSSDSTTSSSADSASKDLKKNQSQTPPDIQYTNKPKSWIIPTDLKLDSDEEDQSNVLTTRATVNLGSSRPDTGRLMSSDEAASKAVLSRALAYEFSLDDGKNNETNRSDATSSTETGNTTERNSFATNLTLTKRFELRKRASQPLNQRADNLASLTSSFASTTSEQNQTPAATPKSNATTNVSLGAKIQLKAAAVAANEQIVSTSIITPQNNRALYLRQQKARAKRESLDRSHVRSSMESNNQSMMSRSFHPDMNNSLSSSMISSSNRTSGGGGILNKQRNISSNPAVAAAASAATKSHHQLLNRSISNLIDTPPPSSSSINSGMNKATASTITTANNNNNKVKKLARSNSRHASPPATNSILNRTNYSHQRHHQQDLMSCSLNLQPGASLPGSRQQQQHQQALIDNRRSSKELFMLRKSYDPQKAVEEAKLRKALKQKQSESKEIVDNFINDNDNESLAAESLSSSFSISKKQQNSYENILQSTLQRLCIRLIKMSTGVLDKIGEGESGKLSSNESRSLFKSSDNGMDNMQDLAKLVHSMQIVNDHMQVIDSTLFSITQEEMYMQELTKIRQDVDNLKLTAAAAAFNNNNNSIRTNAANENNNNNNDKNDNSNNLIVTDF